jgi:hypothetical protein
VNTTTDWKSYAFMKEQEALRWRARAESAEALLDQKADATDSWLRELTDRVTALEEANEPVPVREMPELAAPTGLSVGRPDEGALKRYRQRDKGG